MATNVERIDKRKTIGIGEVTEKKNGRNKKKYLRYTYTFERRMKKKKNLSMRVMRDFKESSKTIFKKVSI